MNPVETYLKELRDIRASGGVPETSGYGALANLLSEVGGKLKPKVRCIDQPQERRRRHPGRRLLHREPVREGQAASRCPGSSPRAAPSRSSRSATTPARSPPPSRCAATSRSTARCWSRPTASSCSSATTPTAGRRSLESFSLARERSGLLGARRASAQRRCPGHRRAPHRVPAARACCARRRSPRRRTSPGSSPPTRARPGPAPRSATCRPWPPRAAALEEALGMSFTGEKGDHFFRSTLVQTLFYGLFAAWVFWAEHHPHGRRAGALPLARGRRATCTSPSCRSSSTTSPTPRSSAP